MFTQSIALHTKQVTCEDKNCNPTVLEDNILQMGYSCTSLMFLLYTLSGTVAQYITELHLRSLLLCIQFTWAPGKEKDIRDEYTALQ